MKRKPAGMRRSTINLIVDSAVFLAFLVAMAPHFSGMAIHEWLGIAFGAAIVTHLLLHWQWIVEITRRMFSGAQWSARVNYLLNALLFIDITVIVFTGLLISEEALPLLGIQLEPGRSWKMLHTLSADAFVYLTAAHVALHWRWIVSTVRRLLPPWRTPHVAAGRAPELQ